MTERKPAGLTFTSWIDQQIQEATERGAFDNLPGAGKPLPSRGDEDAAQAWLRDYLRREGVPAEDALPTPLKLRKERERLAETVADLPSEQKVREVVQELNYRIAGWRRFPHGPPIFVPLVDEEAMVSRWREGQRVTRQASPVTEGGGQPSAGQPARSRRRRIFRRGSRD
jgi:hypothetical protein